MLINGRTPEEIKRGIKCHVCWGDCSTECPYDDVRNKPAHECIQSMTKDAFALIEQLEAKQPKWISVKERLPEIREDGSVDAVLVTDGFLIHMAYCADGLWLFCDSGEMKEPMFYCVTHWMPLPEPPEEEG